MFCSFWCKGNLREFGLAATCSQHRAESSFRAPQATEMHQWVPSGPPGPTAPLGQTTGVITAEQIEASEPILWWRAHSFEVGDHIQMHHCFSLNLIVVPDVGGHGVCTHTPLVPGALMPSYSACWPWIAKSPDYSHRNNTFINAAYCSHLSDTEISDQKYKHWFFSYLFSYSVLFTTLRFFSSLKQAFDLNDFFILASACDTLTIFLFKCTPLCFFSASAEKNLQGFTPDNSQGGKEQRLTPFYYSLICFLWSTN